MSAPLTPSPTPGSPPMGEGSPSPVKRRRWPYWLLAVVLLLGLLVFFLPNILSRPFVRQRLLNMAFSRVGTQATVGDLSLAWFSPVAVDDLKLQPEDTDRAALTVHSVTGDSPLWRLVFGHSLGRFKIVEPELYLHFNHEGTNITRLVRGMASVRLGTRGSELEIVDGRLLLQGESSPAPWPINDINLSLALTPASESSVGAPAIHGEQARLLNQMELTPEMCNDLLKFITPPLFQATRTSGKVSLELDQFNWPLGKPDAVQLSGHLTLHSVDVVPGPVTQMLNTILQNKAAPLSLQIAKDDVVAFNMHDGRVYHENLTFRLAAMQIELLVHSHGSVGLDESLDWFVEFQFPGLEAADLSGHPFMKLLSQQPALHITGTLSQPQWKPDGLATQVLQTGIGLLRQKMEERRQASSQGSQTDGPGQGVPTPRKQAAP